MPSFVARFAVIASLASISRHDRIWFGVFLAAYFLANIAVAWQALSVA
jgi:hypothetical protein